MLKERFPGWAEKVEFWHVDDGPEVLDLIEREVMDLAARLIGGGRKRVAQPPESAAKPVVAKEEMPKKSAPVVRLGRETKGRRGKGVTTVSDVPLDERDRLAIVLEGMGYKVKPVGG